jgi:hypothetical protein
MAQCGGYRHAPWRVTAQSQHVYADEEGDRLRKKDRRKDDVEGQRRTTARDVSKR